MMDNLKQKQWDEYFLNLVAGIGQKSKDPNTKVGAIIVDQNNRIISTGYNGFPAGMDETPELWVRPVKYNFCVHAEINAILYARCSLEDATIYVSFMPCKECAKTIAASGIKRVVCFERDDKVDLVSLDIFKRCAIEFVVY